MRFDRPCLDCGRLTKGNRCPQHQQIADGKRNQRWSEIKKTRKQQLYGTEYRKRAKEVKASATHCHLCLKPFQHEDRIEADHILPGDPSSPLAAAHRECNQKRGDMPLDLWRKQNGQ